MYSIAIDGPSGSGKSTVAQLLAKQLDFNYLNSGAIYRIIALHIIEHNINWSNETDFEWLNNLNLEFKQQSFFLNQRDVTKLIRTPECAQTASKIAVLEPIRNFVNQQILKTSKIANIVVDGRDIGSVVLPDAQLKIYLDASSEVRAKRILEHNLNLKITSKTLQDIIVEVEERDNRDRNRTIAPLIQAPDAFYLDTSHLNKKQVIAQIEKLWNDKAEHDK